MDQKWSLVRERLRGHLAGAAKCWRRPASLLDAPGHSDHPTSYSATFWLRSGVPYGCTYGNGLWLRIKIRGFRLLGVGLAWMSSSESVTTWCMRNGISPHRTSTLGYSDQIRHYQFAGSGQPGNLNQVTPDLAMLFRSGCNRHQNIRSLCRIATKGKQYLTLEAGSFKASAAGLSA